MRLCEGRGRSMAPSPEDHALCDASGHSTQSDSAGPDGKSGPSRRRRNHKEEALSTLCLSASVRNLLREKPSSPFHQRLREPGKWIFLLQPFALVAAFVVNGRFRICGCITWSQIGNPKAARPRRRLQDRGTRIESLNRPGCLPGGTDRSCGSGLIRFRIAAIIIDWPGGVPADRLTVGSGRDFLSHPLT